MYPLLLNELQICKNFMMLNQVFSSNNLVTFRNWLIVCSMKNLKKNRFYF